jgi:hypothetical protein
MRNNKQFLNKKRIISVAAAAFFICIFLAPSCNIFKGHEPVEFSLIELKSNAETGYYDAVILVEGVWLDTPIISRFLLITPTQSLEIEDLEFIADGKNPMLLEKGDVFIVPLCMPDWKLYIREKNEIYGSLNFWDKLPVDNQWHPLKSEAKTVAESLAVELVDGLPKPVAGILPKEWELVDEQVPYQDDPCGFVVYQKIMAENVKEQVNISYCLLTDKEARGLAASSETEYLAGWTEWTHKFGKEDVFAGRAVISWDMPGIGEYGWSYRYIYVDSDVVIEVDLEADPLEWKKTDQEKIVEGKTRKVFLRYGYGPVREPEWQILIEIRMNGEGMFYKRSRNGITIEKAFFLDDLELDRIRIALAENQFRDLRSRSGIPGGINSFLSVNYNDLSHIVKMNNVQLQPFQNIERTIKVIVLPKVDEK